MISYSVMLIAITGLFCPLKVASSCQEIQNVLLTHYGAPDNDPPGPSIGSNCYGHDLQAGGEIEQSGSILRDLWPLYTGTGTASDPITFATADGEFDECELVYIPLYQKYFYKGDSCAQCQTDWQNGVWHIDLWTGATNENGGNTQIQCEDSLPGGEQLVIRDPPTNLPVNSMFLLARIGSLLTRRLASPFFANNQCDISLTFTVSSNSYCSSSPITDLSSSGSFSRTSRAASFSRTSSAASFSRTSSAASFSRTSIAAQCSWVGHCIGTRARCI